MRRARITDSFILVAALVSSGITSPRLLARALDRASTSVPASPPDNAPPQAGEPASPEIEDLATAGAPAGSPAERRSEAPGEAAKPALSLPRYALPLIGSYRKTMEIEDEIRAACERYGLPVPLARAVCMYESGGDDHLTSSAGAHGYFQLMPATFRLMKVPSNIEAGVKYLASLVRGLGREDDAIAAYNGGPGRVSRGRPMPIETLQYVVGVGIYRTLLTHEEDHIRAVASALGLHRVEPGESWETASARTGIPLGELRLYNPYLATRPLRPGALIAYPRASSGPLLAGDPSGGNRFYMTRRGDNYLLLAFAFGVDLDTFRRDNALWRIQPPFEGMRLVVSPVVLTARSSLTASGASDPAAVSADAAPDLQGLPHGSDGGPAEAGPGALSEAGTIESIGGGEAAGPAGGAAPSSAVFFHRVRKGDTLHRIAAFYGVTIDSIRKANHLKRSRLRIGQILRIPPA